AYWSVVLCRSCLSMTAVSVFFFFQAEDGIRDFHVTGVQTCALPILKFGEGKTPESTGIKGDHFVGDYYVLFGVEHKKEVQKLVRSEERRVGKECRSRWSPDH